MRVKQTALTLFTLLLLAGACSAPQHDCYETRTCPESQPILSGSSDGGQSVESAGSAGEADATAGASAGASGSAERTSSSQGETPAAEVVELPNVLSVNPSDQALGVTRDARIVITFTRAMDTTATESAYESSDLPASALTFSWNRGATVLTLSPRAPLEYAQSPEGVGDPAGFPARTYHYGFSALAVDQQGQALGPVSFTFSTLRHGSIELQVDRERTGNWTTGEGEGIHNCLRNPDPKYEPTVCIGDDINNVRYAGFVTFDLSALPDAIAQVTSARLLASAAVHGAPGELGSSRIDQVTFAELDETALGVPAISSHSPLFVSTSLTDDAQLALDWDVTAAVADDYLNRVSRAQRTQYRLSFPKVSANHRWDDVELPTSRIALVVGYLVP